MNRRTFLGASAAGLALGLSRTHADAPSNRILIGVMGTGGRGTSLATTFVRQKGVEVAYVCDVDKGRADQAAGAVEKIAGKAPKAVGDFRRILDDKLVDVLVCATCNHWHAPATILACAANKHVYVEKPCSHNPREGELMVAAARKHRRQVQMGNQRRSWPAIMEAITKLREGVLGRVYLATAYYTANRNSIGRGRAAPVPDGFDYDLWQGPAPRREFRTNYLHYNWHWFWHWGNGELGNNGVHMIDLCRWGLGVDYPTRVTSAGGRYRFEDDQETPDTHIVSFEYPGKKAITWQGLSCNQLPDAKQADVVFFGDKGSLAIRGNGYTIHDLKGKEIHKNSATSPDSLHILNFLEAIRSAKSLNSEIEEAHKSTLPCHLGNIAHRTGRTLKCDPKAGQILDDKEAAAMWSREYAPGWEPKV
jgi:predicted dehydrogenase